MSLLKRVGEAAGLSVKALLLALAGILLFGIYLGILIDGENSLTVLTKLKRTKSSLMMQENIIKQQNQRLQKEYFELKQLEPKE